MIDKQIAESGRAVAEAAAELLYLDFTTPDGITEAHTALRSAGTSYEAMKRGYDTLLWQIVLPNWVPLLSVGEEEMKATLLALGRPAWAKSPRTAAVGKVPVRLLAPLAEAAIDAEASIDRVLTAVNKGVKRGLIDAHTPAKSIIDVANRLAEEISNGADPTECLNETLENLSKAETIAGEDTLFFAIMDSYRMDDAASKQRAKVEDLKAGLDKSVIERAFARAAAER